MFPQVLRFVRLPLMLILLFSIFRFILGPVLGVPYAPRGNSMASIVVLTLVSSLYFGAMARNVGGFGWLGTVLIGVVLGLWSQILIFLATTISIFGHIDTYFLHWDALNIPQGTTIPVTTALGRRALGIVTFPIMCAIAACLARVLFGWLAPTPRAEQRLP